MRSFVARFIRGDDEKLLLLMRTESLGLFEGLGMTRAQDGKAFS